MRNSILLTIIVANLFIVLSGCHCIHRKQITEDENFYIEISQKWYKAIDEELGLKDQTFTQEEFDEFMQGKYRYKIDGIPSSGMGFCQVSYLVDDYIEVTCFFAKGKNTNLPHVQRCNKWYRIPETGEWGMR